MYFFIYMRKCIDRIQKVHTVEQSMNSEQKCAMLCFYDFVDGTAKTYILFIKCRHRVNQGEMI
jgi:hypothetical protein